MAMVSLWKTKSNQIEPHLFIDDFMKVYEIYSWNSKTFHIFPLKWFFVFLLWPSWCLFTPKYLMRVVPVHLFFSEDCVICLFSYPKFLPWQNVLSEFENCFVILGIVTAYLHQSENSLGEQLWIFRSSFPFGDYNKTWCNIFWHSFC